MESFALVQARLGMEAIHALNDAVVPMLEVEWVTSADHETASVTMDAVRPSPRPTGLENSGRDGDGEISPTRRTPY